MRGSRGPRSWARSTWVLLAVLLLGEEPGRANICAVMPSVLWPAGIRDVPRQVRPILLNARPHFPDAPSQFQIRLLDIGSSQAGDVLAPVPDVPQGAREVRSRLRPFGELGDSAGAVEVVPDEVPLPANHRFLVTIGERPLAAFATSERLELRPGSEVPQLVVYDVVAPSIYGGDRNSVGVPREDAQVILLLPGPERWPRMLVFSVATDDGSSGRFLVEARDRRVSVGGAYVCGVGGGGPKIGGPGRTELLIREWTPAGLSAPVHVSVEIPKPKHRRDWRD